MIFIDVAMMPDTGFGLAGYVVARSTGREPPVALVVGQVEVWQGTPEQPRVQWKAYLWAAATSYPPRGRHCEAVTRPDQAKLLTLLRDRADRQGPWWIE